ncbi:AraC family transcriptional regulator [Pelomonas sp. CA6]|uniref:AraC family transcriptional regulator n=1 Tax=Pelomonas sp. CA6 TaxID=2907999 RepID=UPI001F4BE4AB|nr:AraC family transcriptional regulator [Pelomonas sp. CA6]MCH7345254.1 AraC family transcriptional regulator [Pelomonas sp. CA6]
MKFAPSPALPDRAMIDTASDITFLRQDSGRFDRRHAVGPVCWPHFDLLWLHEGRLRLQLDASRDTVELCAPDGVLLFPATPFSGQATTPHAEASICHFRLPTEHAPGWRRPRATEALALQAMVVLSLRLARQGAELRRRQRLLAAVLDGFGGEAAPAPADHRIDRAWRLAAERLHRIRGLSDVAAQAGLSESSFRASHRAWRGDSAGAALTALRLGRAEHLLATTRLSIAEIALAVGYGHAETLSQAFRRTRGLSPGAWRQAQRPFA